MIHDADNKLTDVSISILTYNRKTMLKELLHSLEKIEYHELEIIVIDNDSADHTQEMVKRNFPDIVYHKMIENLGVAGRNAGISKANGDIIITLDDDVIGIDLKAIKTLIDIFKKRPKVGAICFKIIDPVTTEVINWCHHYKIEEFSDREFITNEITEGAVAFRRSVLQKTGLYPDDFFISHEGPDLACRIMNAGFNVVFSPKITVEHFHSQSGRSSWRRYYYDTRNQFWFVARNYPGYLALQYLFIGVGAMLLYSIRDGHLRFWLKGVYDGIKGYPEHLKARTIISSRTRSIISSINAKKPGIFYLLRKRIFKEQIRL